LSPDVLKKMLPMLAMAVGGYMAKQSSGAAAAPATGGGLGGLVGGLLGGGDKQAGASGGGGLASLLDMNGDGNALDDVLRLGGKILR
jgi:hypothetical protein